MGRIFALILASSLLALSACSDNTSRKDNIPESSSTIVVAVVLSRLPDGDDSPHSLFLYNAIDDGHGSDLFYAGVPSDIVDSDGNAIVVTDIKSGQLVEITYGGIVQYTYPATYTDVSKVMVLGKAATDLYALASERAVAWESQFNTPG